MNFILTNWMFLLIILLLLIVIVILIKKKLPEGFLKNVSEGVKGITAFIGKANSEYTAEKYIPSSLRMNSMVVTWSTVLCLIGIHIYAFASKWAANSIELLLLQDIAIISGVLGIKVWQKGKENDPK